MTGGPLRAEPPDRERALVEATLRGAISALDAELAAIRTRLAALEAGAGRVGDGPPPLIDLHRRLAALERRATGTTVPVPTAVFPRSRPHGWGQWGQAVLAVALLAGMLLWLLRPLPGTAHPGWAPADAPLAPPLQATATSLALAVPAARAATWPPCDHTSDAGCPWNAGQYAVAPATPSSP